MSTSALMGRATRVRHWLKMNARSHSASAALIDLLFGPVTTGTIIGPRLLKFGAYVVIVTEPKQPRMPNGIESDVRIRASASLAIGRGQLAIGSVGLTPGPAWNPVPELTAVRSLPPGPEPVASALAALSADPSTSEDLLAGYIAGLVLLHGLRDRAGRIAERAAALANPLHATLLGHAARGEVPEPVHALLGQRDPGPLLAFGGASGHRWLRGLVSAGLPLESWLSTVGSPFTLPLVDSHA